MSEIPRYLFGEEQAIEMVIEQGKRYGFGNMISNLQRAWSVSLQNKHGLNKISADMWAGIICLWCHVDRRTGERVNIKDIFSNKVQK
jgi:hypothetical protein